MINLSPPRWIARLAPGITWNIPNDEGIVYLTFDDGPMQGITDWVLDELWCRGVKATFFCLGRNAERYPELLARIRAEGHSVGNHTYSHLRGYSVSTHDYYADALLADELLKSDLFRPPYGRITLPQMRQMASRFRVVLWSVLSMDYSWRVPPALCLHFVQHNVRAGDIVVFHDSHKAERNLRYVLPRALDYLLAAGFRFAPLGAIEADTIISPLPVLPVPDIVWG